MTKKIAQFRLKIIFSRNWAGIADYDYDYDFKKVRLRKRSMTDDNYSAKIHTYSALSGCYLPPDENLQDLVNQLSLNIIGWIPEAETPLKFMLSDLKKQGNDLSQMTLDYSRLFLGPFETLAPPFGSIYLNPSKKMIMDETTAEVADLYVKAGLDLNKDFHYPADHITAELEFMHYLYFQEQASMNKDDKEKADELQKLRSEFFNKHLGKWGSTFTGKVESSAQMDFYRQLALVTRMVLSKEAQK
jgi:putative dimethyl sulfoxide reductase chaperone